MFTELLGNLLTDPNVTFLFCLFGRLGKVSAIIDKCVLFSVGQRPLQLTINQQGPPGTDRKSASTKNCPRQNAIAFCSYRETWTIVAALMCVVLDRGKAEVGKEVELIEAAIEVGDQVFGPVLACCHIDTCSFRLNLCC